MFPHIDFDTTTAERAERLRNARQRQVAIELRQARRFQRWAERSARVSGWLAGLARSRRARLG